jgi:gliding motility-associated-like protein
MKNWSLNIILTFLFSLSTITYSQVTCTPPLPPVLNSVSVQPATGYTEFTWALSPSTNVAAYLIYSYHNESGIPRGDIIDTIWDPAATTYLYRSTVTNYYSVSYVIAAFRVPNCTSPFSNVINSLFTKSTIDTCNKKIIINWNSYPSVPKNVVDYSILVSVNSGNMYEAGKAGSDKNTFTLNEFLNDADYCFVVRANLEDGTFSTSNKSCLSTKMQRPPDWINADYATVDNNNIIVSFSVDPLSMITSYRLERKVENENDFSLLKLIESGNKTILYTDKTADPLKRNYYRLLAVNNCGNPVVASNFSCNLVARLETNGNTIKLSWDPSNFRTGRVSGYKVFINTGNGFREESGLSSSDSLYTLNYSSVMFDITGNNLCFYVSVSESGNPHGIYGESSSEVICTGIIENIIVPNTFTPNNDLINDYFKPVLSFTPVQYHLVITSRSNEIVFESLDYQAQWDGRHNGESLPDGVYLWYLKLKTASGKQISKTGTVTIIK